MAQPQPWRTQGVRPKPNWDLLNNETPMSLGISSFVIIVDTHLSTELSRRFRRAVPDDVQLLFDLDVPIALQLTTLDFSNP